MNKVCVRAMSDIDGGNARLSDWRLAGIALSFLLAAGMASTEIQAASASEIAPVRVRYHQRELASTTAARNLVKRIGDAALESCGASSFSLVEFKAATRASRCWRDAVGEAVRHIGNPVLTAAVVEDR
jgi:UrcA family protein